MKQALVQQGCMYVKVVQSCPTLCFPMDCSPTGNSIHGIFQARYWSGLPFPSPGDLPDPRIEPRSPHCRQTLYHLNHSRDTDSKKTAILGGLITDLGLQRLPLNENGWECECWWYSGQTCSKTGQNQFLDT